MSRIRVDVVGKLHRHRQIKQPQGGGVLDRLFSQVLMADLHKDGKLATKYYWPEWAGVTCAEGALPQIALRARFLKFGVHGTACKKHWQPIKHDTQVRLIADVVPYQNRMGGKIVRVLELEPKPEEPG